MSWIPSRRKNSKNWDIKINFNNCQNMEQFCLTINAVMHPKDLDADGTANSEDSDQTALLGEV